MDLVYVQHLPTFDSRTIARQPSEYAHCTEASKFYLPAFTVVHLCFIFLIVISPFTANLQIPAWPFLLLSIFAGCYILCPYLILHDRGPPEDAQTARSAASLPGRLWFTFTESKIYPVLLLAFFAYGIQQGVAQAPNLGVAIADFSQDFFKYRLAHASTLDFTLYTLLVPHWMWKDAGIRNMENRSLVVPAASLVPLLGPLVYLLLRPSLD